MCRASRNLWKTRSFPLTTQRLGGGVFSDAINEDTIYGQEEDSFSSPEAVDFTDGLGEESAEENTEILLGADAGEVWVNNVNLIKDSDHEIKCGQGTASYDPNTHILTLENATVNIQNATDQTYQSYVWLNTANDCIIALKGNNYIGRIDSGSYGAIKAACNLTIEGPGTLEIEAGGANMSKQFDGINSPNKAITIQNTAVTMKNTAAETNDDFNNFYGITNGNSGDITIFNTTLDITDYNAAILGKDIEIKDNSIISIKALDPYIKAYYGINGHNVTIQKSSLDYKLSKGADLFNPISGTYSVTLDEVTADITMSEDNEYYSCITSPNGKVIIKNRSKVNAKSTAPAIYANQAITIEDSRVQAVSTKSAAIWTPGTMEISGTSDIEAEGFYGGLQSSGDMTISGGKIVSTSSNGSSIFSTGKLDISGTAEIETDGFKCGLQSDGDMVISGGKVNATSNDDVAIFTRGKLEISGTADIKADARLRGLQSNGDMIIVGGTIDAASSTSVAIWTKESLTVSGTADIEANGYGCGMQSEKDMTISGGHIDAISSNDVGIFSLGIIDISGGKVHAKGAEKEGRLVAAISTRRVQVASEDAAPSINIGTTIAEKNKGKIAISGWMYHDDSKKNRSLTSFISNQDMSLEVQNNIMQNALNEVWLAPAWEVTFDVNGGTGGNTTVKVYPGNTVEPPASLTKPGYWLEGWLTESGSYFDFSSTPVNQDMTLRAVWVPNVSYYTIEASAGKHGTVSPSGSVSVREYTNQTFTFTPDEGYETAEVLVDGKKVETTDSYRFESVTSSHTIAVSFLKKVPDTYPDGTVAKPDGSFVTPEGVEILPDGTVILNDKDKTELKPDSQGNKAVVNKDGTVTVQDGSVRNSDGTYRRPARPIIDRTVIKGNRVNIYLKESLDGAAGYDYVISPNPNCIIDKDYTRVNKNILLTNTSMFYVQQDTYYAYCHSWLRGSDGKKVFSQWSEPYKFTVSDYTPDTPSIVKVTNPKKGEVVVTVRVPEGAKGFDIILGRSIKKENGEKRPVDYGTNVIKNRSSTLKTVTFKNVKPGRVYAALHSYTRAQESNIKVFSPWSSIRFLKVK